MPLVASITRTMTSMICAPPMMVLSQGKQEAGLRIAFSPSGAAPASELRVARLPYEGGVAGAVDQRELHPPIATGPDVFGRIGDERREAQVLGDAPAGASRWQRVRNTVTGMLQSASPRASCPHLRLLSGCLSSAAVESWVERAATRLVLPLSTCPANPGMTAIELACRAVGSRRRGDDAHARAARTSPRIPTFTLRMESSAIGGRERWRKHELCTVV